MQLVHLACVSLCSPQILFDGLSDLCAVFENVCVCTPFLTSLSYLCPQQLLSVSERHLGLFVMDFES